VKRAQIFLLALAGAPLVGGAPVAAATGVSIDVGAIAVSEALAPGGEYRLPAFGIRNPGNERTSYTFIVSDAGTIDPDLPGDAAALAPPADWFRFEPSAVTLGPGESASVSTMVVLPVDAEPGDYSALIGAQISIDAGGARVGGAAAARLTFSVIPSNPIDAWLRNAGRFLAVNPWVVQLVLGIGLLIGLILARRRFTITIARR
jgi:hypothetical protein